MTVAHTTGGDVEGAARSGVLRFASVPYAQPPVGALRFAAPQPIEPWEGIRPAIDLGPVSLQNDAPLQDALGFPPLPCSEDCLTLTVHTPGADDHERPVMVWLHGGGFITGSGRAPIGDASRLCARGDVVVVSVNYRLGTLGFLHLGDLDPAVGSSGINGILDQIAALEWVRDNIAAFGGDPENVTVFGASAGAKSIATLLVLPAASGLFRRAILQSGAGHGVLDRDEAARRTRRFCELTGRDTVDGLRALDESQILTAQAALDAELRQGSTETVSWASTLTFQPVIDGVHLVAPPVELARRGALAGVDLLTGTTDEEWRMFSILAPGPDTDAELAARFADVLDAPEAAIDTYRNRLGSGAAPARVYDAMMTDARFRVPMHRLADASASAGNRTWLYRFAHRSPAAGGALGSCHALDVPFVFDNRDGPISTFVGVDSPDALAEAMQQAWLSFARHGDPNHEGIPSWAPQDGGRRPVIRFDRHTTMTEDPEPDELALWAGVL